MTVFCRARLGSSALLAIGWLAGCAMRPVTVDSLWAEGAPQDQSYANLLIVGLTPDRDVRCRFEQSMTAALRYNGVSATSSCAEMRPEEPLTKDGIIPVVAATGADAVLVTELLDRQVDVVEGGDEETRGEAYYKPIGYGYAYRYPSYYGSYGLPVTYVEFTAEQSAFTLQRSVVVASNLYATRDASLVYSMQVTAENQKSREDVLAVVRDGVVERLRRDGLVSAGR